MEPWMSQRVPAWQTGFLEIETAQRLDYGGKGPLKDTKGTGVYIPPFLSRRNASAWESTTAAAANVPYGAFVVVGALIALGYVCLA